MRISALPPDGSAFSSPRDSPFTASVICSSGPDSERASSSASHIARRMASPTPNAAWIASRSSACGFAASVIE
jgi:hypothetical protein